MFAPKVNKLAANFTFGIPSFDISKILLDVYKRQAIKFEDKYRDKVSALVYKRYCLCFFITSARAKEYLEEYEYLESCLLYTSRCV